MIYNFIYHTACYGQIQQKTIDDIILIFLRKKDLTFHSNCLLKWQFAYNVKFSRKNKKDIIKMSSAEIFTQHAKH